MIWFELKKLWKNKILLVAILVFFGTYAASFYNEYFSEPDYEVKNEQGEVLSYIDWLRLKDRTMHEWKSDVVDQNLVDRVYKEYQEKIKKYETEEFNHDKMVHYYGANYKEIVQKYLDGTLTQEEANALMKYQATHLEYSNIYIYEDEIIFPLFYKNDEIINGLNQVYCDETMYATISDVDKNDLAIADYLKSNFSDISYGSLKTEDKKVFSLEDYNHLKKRFETADLHFESNVGAKQLISFYSNNFMYMLAFVLGIVLFSNLFAIEHHSRMEHILACSKYGNRKLVIAKLCAFLLVILGIMALYTVVSYVAISCIVPVRDLSLMGVRIGSNYNTGFHGLLPFTYTYFDVWVLDGILLFLLFLIGGSFASFLSATFKNQFVPAILGLCVFFMPLLYTSGFENIHSISQFFLVRMVPSFMIWSDQLINGLDISSSLQVSPWQEIFGIRLHVIVWIALFWIVICACCWFIIYRNKRKHLV